LPLLIAFEFPFLLTSLYRCARVLAFLGACAPLAFQLLIGLGRTHYRILVMAVEVSGRALAYNGHSGIAVASLGKNR